MTGADTDLVMICTCDVAGQVRGKAVPRAALARRGESGVGWTPTNVFITAFGPIAASPWGALGDLYIRPDMATLIDLDCSEFGVRERFVMGDVMALDGTPWTCCLRGQLASAIADLEQRHGLRVVASFEHEFHYFGAEALPGLGYALRAFRRLGPFPDRLMAVLDAAGLELDTFMPEYGAGQCEVTVGPRPALRAADDAVILRELTRAVARGLGTRASFAPIVDPMGVGNGVHVHFSLEDRNGLPITYDGRAAHGLSAAAAGFVAGILKHLPEFLAMTAPSVASYLRLVPHRWSAAFNNLGRQDREAGIRICPVFGADDEAALARKFHVEFRAADAAASPYLVLAALIRAGMSGLDEGLAAPPVTEADLAAKSPQALAAMGCERLPTSLPAALARMTASSWAKHAFGATLIDVIDRHKRAEIEIMATLSTNAMCERYTAAY